MISALEDVLPWPWGETDEMSIFVFPFEFVSNFTLDIPPIAFSDPCVIFVFVSPKTNSPLAAVGLLEAALDVLAIDWDTNSFSFGEKSAFVFEPCAEVSNAASEILGDVPVLCADVPAAAPVTAPVAVPVAVPVEAAPDEVAPEVLTKDVPDVPTEDAATVPDDPEVAEAAEVPADDAAAVPDGLGAA